MFNPEEVEGYNRLKFEAHKTLFKQFLINFYNAWGLEARSTFKPISVEFCRNKSDGLYLRFVYEMYGRKEWLHVKNAYTWY